MKFSVKDFFSKCDQLSGFLRVWSRLLKISIMKNFIFCALLSLKSPLSLLTLASESKNRCDAEKKHQFIEGKCRIDKYESCYSAELINPNRKYKE